MLSFGVFPALPPSARSSDFLFRSLDGVVRYSDLDAPLNEGINTAMLDPEGVETFRKPLAPTDALCLPPASEEPARGEDPWPEISALLTEAPVG